MIAIFFNQNSDKNKIANYKTFINFYETYKSNDEYIIINFNFENESNNYKEISENIVLINNDTKLFTFTEYKYFV